MPSCLSKESISQLLQLLERNRRTQLLRLHKSFECPAQMHPLFQRRWYVILFAHSLTLLLTPLTLNSQLPLPVCPESKEVMFLQPLVGAALLWDWIGVHVVAWGTNHLVVFFHCSASGSSFADFIALYDFCH